jgi:hypothetical protein
MSFSCKFLLVYSGLPDSGLEKSGSSAKDLDHLHTRGFASGGIQEEKKRELRKVETVETMVPHFCPTGALVRQN